MSLRKWEELPDKMKVEDVLKYYRILEKKKGSLILKRLFDFVFSLLLLVILIPAFLFLAISIKLDSKGPVFYRQNRITQYGKQFRIHKFRSMVIGADKGSQVTIENDSRVTKVGKLIRKFRLDEIPQLIDIFEGKMTFVGTRPEVKKYVDEYSHEMMATLLLPAGVTSLASIYFMNETELLGATDDTDNIYISKVLPEKMKYNLKGIEDFSFWGDIKIMFMTIFTMLGKNYKVE